MLTISLIPRDEFLRVSDARLDRDGRLELIADMCRANTLATVKRAGSGHLGSSMSCLDVVTWLYYEGMNTVRVGFDHPDRDIFFSSKGHDAPGHYSVLYSLGVIPRAQFINLRRHGGTHGHPDVSIPGMEANTGSLGMGVSKAKGLAYGKHLNGHGGQVYVMTGDGELHEGQIWEALQTTAHQGIVDVWAIVDHNKIQTDLPVEKIISLRRLEEKFTAFGWQVDRCNGHDFAAIRETFARMALVRDKPKILIADTVKGRGISFMEGLGAGEEIYRWHSGAPDDESYVAAHAELVDRINGAFARAGLGVVALEEIETRETGRTTLKSTAEKVVTAFGEALVEIGARRRDVVVLDADLSADCGLRPFEQAYPERFIENGIAEQDMVSMAGGLALGGFLPVVNSFGVFLASRANEQIYNNSTERTKVIYVCHYAGLIPAGPGKSHQSLRDISLFGALPNCVILEPCNAVETRQALEWCIDQAQDVCMMRLVISPSPRTIELPAGYSLTFGKGAVLRQGHDAVLFAYGPVMLNEALVAAEILDGRGISLRVVNLPWLNRVEAMWLEAVLADTRIAFALDNHSSYGGVGDSLTGAIAASDSLRGHRLVKFGVEGHAACGTPPEALRHHGLDAETLARRIAEALGHRA